MSPVEGPLEKEDVLRLLSALRRQRGLLFSFWGAVVTTVLVVGFLQTPLYESDAVLRIRPNAAREMKFEQVLDANTKGHHEIQQFLRTEMLVFETRQIGREVLRRYHAAGETDLGTDLEAMEQLRNRVEVHASPKSRIVTITAKDTTPERAALVANLFAEAYREHNLRVQREMSASATQWVAGQLRDLEAQRDAADADLLAFRQTHSLATLPSGEDDLSTIFASTVSALAERRADRLSFEVMVRQSQRMMAEGKLDPLSQVLASPTLDRLAAARADAIAEHADVITRYGEKHVAYIDSREKVVSVTGALQRELGAILAGDEARFAGMLSSEAALEAEVDRLKDGLLAQEVHRAELAQKVSDRDTLSAVVAEVSTRLQELKINARTVANNVALVDQAVPQTDPAEPRILLYLAASLVLGGIAGCGLALLREYLDDTVRDRHDVELALRLPLVSVVPEMEAPARSTPRGYWADGNRGGATAEAIRALRTMISLGRRRRPTAVLAVTGAVRGDGASTLACWLGASYARSGAKVLVIDCNQADATVAANLSLKGASGLSEALMSDGLDVGIQSTRVDGLFAMTWGSTGLDESVWALEFPALLARLKQSFDMILLDTPPILGAAAGREFAARADAALFVMRDGGVRRSAASEALDQLRYLQVEVVGAVLNRVNLRADATRHAQYAETSTFEGVA